MPNTNCSTGMTFALDTWVSVSNRLDIEQSKAANSQQKCCPLEN